MNCCKFQIVFKSYRKLANVFGFKDRLPFNLVSGVIHKYTCGRCNSSYYGETDRHLKVRSAEHIGISPLTVRKVKPSKRLQFVTNFLIAIISHPLMSLPPWHTDIISIFFKSKKVCLLSVIGLSSIRILVLLNCFFLTITRTLHNFIIPQYFFIMLFDMFVTVIVMKVTKLFEIEVKNLIFYCKAVS